MRIADGKHTISLKNKSNRLGIMKMIRAVQNLVSCIMPTFNRRVFVPQAIQYFLRQGYDNKELIVVDDGDDSVGDLIPNDVISYMKPVHKSKKQKPRLLRSVLIEFIEDMFINSRVSTLYVRLKVRKTQRLCL